MHNNRQGPPGITPTLVSFWRYSKSLSSRPDGEPNGRRRSLAPTANASIYRPSHTNIAKTPVRATGELTPPSWSLPSPGVVETTVPMG
jgi:hypothetical protein